MNKEARINLWCSVIFLVAVLVLSMYFVVGEQAHILDSDREIKIVNYSGLDNTGIVNEDSGFIFNFSINNTGGVGFMNITQINISLFGDFQFMLPPAEHTVANVANGSGNITFHGYFTNVSFMNTTTNANTLSFYSENDYNYLIPGNVTTNTSYFYFNMSAPEPGKYNVSIRVYFNHDATIVSNETNVTIRVKDMTIPQTANFSGFVTRGNYSGTIILNASISDNGGVSAVFFNITNISSNDLGQNNITIAKNSSTSPMWWNVSLDTTTLTDGIYNITIWANDSENNMNSTMVIENVTIDNTAPSAVTVTSANDSRSSITATIVAADATSGISGTCSVDRSGATVTGTGTSQILREDNLVCGQSYPYIVTCTDHAGNSRASATSTFTTDGCSGGGGGGSGTTATYTWTNTYTTTEAQFTEGFTKQLSVKNRVRITVSGLSHHVGVKEVTGTSATIEIASEPVEVNLDVGGEAKVDVTDNGYYDIYVKLNAIVDGKADVTVMKINELMPEDAEGSVETTGEVVEEEEEIVEEEEEKDSTWLWIIIGILVLAAIVGGGVAVKKKK